jgi:hypothetical protein
VCPSKTLLTILFSSILTTCSSHSSFLLLISAIMSGCPYIFLSSWLFWIFHSFPSFLLHVVFDVSKWNSFIPLYCSTLVKRTYMDECHVLSILLHVTAAKCCCLVAGEHK